MLTARSSLRSGGCASRKLSPTVLRRALRCGRDRRRGRTQRRDGWTPWRIRTFLDALSRNGSVAKAAGAAGMSRQSAYALRASAKGQAFDDAWRAALLTALPEIPDEVMKRAFYGQVEPIFRNGKLWGERHRLDNRLAMRVLRRLDRMAASQSAATRVVRAVADDFEAFVEIVCSGDEAGADAFLRSRCAQPRASQTANVSILPIVLSRASRPVSSPGFPGEDQARHAPGMAADVRGTSAPDHDRYAAR